MSPAKSGKGKSAKPEPADKAAAPSPAKGSSPPPPRRSSKTPATPPKLDKKPGATNSGSNVKGTKSGVVVPPTQKLRPKKMPRVRRSKPGKTPRETREKVREAMRKLAIKKALKTQKKVIKSSDNGRSRVRKVRTTIRFHRPRTFRPPRNPKFPRMAVPKRNRLDLFNIIEYPLASEAAMKKIEDQNTLVFICHPKATKFHIRAATKKILEVDVVKVNTLICPNGKKKAYVKLSRDYDALDQANKIGII